MDFINYDNNNLLKLYKSIEQEGLTRIKKFNELSNHEFRNYLMEKIIKHKKSKKIYKITSTLNVVRTQDPKGIHGAEYMRLYFKWNNKNVKATFSISDCGQTETQIIILIRNKEFNMYDENPDEEDFNDKSEKTYSMYYDGHENKFEKDLQLNFCEPLESNHIIYHFIKWIWSKNYLSNCFVKRAAWPQQNVLCDVYETDDLFWLVKKGMMLNNEIFYSCDEII